MTNNFSTAPSGSQIELAYGKHSATITSVGAMVREYRVGGRDVFVPFGRAEIAPVYNAAILAPWPNRLADGAYTFEGYHGQLPVTEIARMNALHGLVAWADWVVDGHDSSSVELHYDLPPRPGWPYTLRFNVRYALDEGGLRCTMTASNLGSETAPYGVGFHPWLSSGGASLDDCEVRLDATDHVITDTRLLPTGVEPVSGDYDLRVRRSLKGLDLDDAWLSPTYDDDGKSWCILYCPDGKAPAVWTDKSLPAWQVCSADHIPKHYRFGLAAEPMTCVANAFNTGDLLIRLAPGESHTVTWGATLL